jgi:hypothetical protein
MKRNRLPRPSASARARRWLAGSALLTAGAAGGGYLAASSSAGASTAGTTGTGSASSTAAAGSVPTPPWAGARPSRMPGQGLSQSGTVTAVGASSVTIRSSSGTTTTYAVVADSDIDKNGEAKLSNLAVGDKVTFDYVTSGTTKTIGHLHAGSEALDRPTPDGNGPGSGHLPGAGPLGAPGSNSGSTSTSGSNSSAA